MVVDHFETQHSRFLNRQFVVQLPRKVNAPTIGESRSQAISRFVYLEKLLVSKGLSGQFNDVIGEYFDMGHTEPVPEIDFKNHNIKYSTSQSRLCKGIQAQLLRSQRCLMHLINHQPGSP